MLNQTLKRLRVIRPDELTSLMYSVTLLPIMAYNPLYLLSGFKGSAGCWEKLLRTREVDILLGCLFVLVDCCHCWFLKFLQVVCSSCLTYCVALRSKIPSHPPNSASLSSYFRVTSHLNPFSILPLPLVCCAVRHALYIKRLDSVRYVTQYKEVYITDFFLF